MEEAPAADASSALRRRAQDLESLKESREAAKEAREVAKEKREVFVYRSNQVKDILHPCMLVVAILYPTIIGFTLQARGWHFSVTHPRPFDGDIWNKDNHGPKHGDGSGPNQWVTFSPTVLARTVGSFLAYTLVHTVLAAQMRLRGVDPTAPALSKAFSWIVPCIFCYVGTHYFYVYVSLSRYGTHWTDWTVMAIFTGLLCGITFALLKFPLTVARLIDRLAEKDPAVKEESVVKKTDDAARLDLEV